MKKLTTYGMSPVLWLTCCAIILIAVYLGVLPNDMIGALAICLGVGTISVFIGDRIPIWKTYMGGGILLTMFVGSSAKYFHWLPDSTLETISNFIGAMGFLNLFIVVLIVGSVLAVDRNVLLRAISRFIPCILGAVVGAGILSVAVGMIFGVGPAEVLSYYALPIMSGGSGAGALPLGQMFAEITGQDFDQYISISMATLTLGDLFAVITATVMGRVVSNNKKLCGDGRLLKGEDPMEQAKEIEKPTMADLANCLIIILAVYMLATIFSTKILPSIAGVSIHMFAYAVIFTVIIKVANIIPDNILSALVYTQKYFVAAFVVVIMFCCGAAYTDMATLIQCITNPVTIIICLAVVIGATIGGGVAGRFLGLFPYEAAVTAGLCMANAGGAGDVAVLSSCKRMNLMPYAQISSRIGNAIILLIGSFIFSTIINML